MMIFTGKHGPGLGLFLILFLGVLHGPAAAGELEFLQKRLRESGASWVAGETSLSHLTREEFSQMLGFQPAPPAGAGVEQGAPPSGVLLSALPPSVDWRSNDGENWISPVKNQHQCGACYAFATLAALETLIKLGQQDPLFPTDLSEQYLISCGPWGVRNGYDYGGCLGNYSDYIGDELMYVGVPDEGCFPFDDNQVTGTEPLCDGACGDWMSRVTAIAGWSYIAPQANYYLPHPDEIKAVLVNKPVPCGMTIYEDFKHYAGGIYDPPADQESLGGHFVCIIGYDDSQSCWIVKNSWGTQWGEDGFFRIGYKESTINARTLFGIEALDLDYGDAPTTSTTTTTQPVNSSTTTTVDGGLLPNVVPCAPPGWSYPIVPAAVQGTTVFNSSADALYPTPRKTYIDIALCNDSKVAVTDSFRIALLIDGVELFSARVGGDLAGNSYRVWLDEAFSLSPGRHLLTLVADVNDEVMEADEADNSFSMDFSWDGAVWAGLYGKMLGDNPAANIRLLRDFRDRVLIPSPAGKRYVEVLYGHSLELALILLRDGGLRVRTGQVIGALLPHLPRVLKGNGVTLSSRTVLAFEALLERFAAQAEPETKKALTSVKKSLEAGEIFEELGISVR